jgi:hypothetical protein
VKRVLLFLLLAGGGLAGLIQAAGGFLGEKQDDVKPEVPVLARNPVAAGPDEAPLRISEFPVNPDGRTPDVTLRRIQELDVPLTREREWKDPVTGERVVLPYFTEMSLLVKDLESFRDPSTGAPGERWKDVHVTVYRDPSTLTRVEAERLAADPAERRHFVLYEIDAAEGHANFPMGPVAEGQGTPSVRTLLYLRKAVRIHIIREDVRIETSDVTVDREAGTAEGPSEITATNASFVFREERLAAGAHDGVSGR